MQNDLISRSALDSFFYSETSGTDEMIENAVMKYPDMEIEFADDCRALCKDIIEMCRNVIKTEPTAYDVEKVVEELKQADTCPNCSMYCADANICGHEEMRKQAINIVLDGGIE